MAREERTFTLGEMCALSLKGMTGAVEIFQHEDPTNRTAQVVIEGGEDLVSSILTELSELSLSITDQSHDKAKSSVSIRSSKKRGGSIFVKNSVLRGSTIIVDGLVIIDGVVQGGEADGQVMPKVSIYVPSMIGLEVSDCADVNAHGTYGMLIARLKGVSQKLHVSKVSGDIDINLFDMSKCTIDEVDNGSSPVRDQTGGCTIRTTGTGSKFQAQGNFGSTEVTTMDMSKVSLTGTCQDLELYARGMSKISFAGVIRGQFTQRNDSMAKININLQFQPD